MHLKELPRVFANKIDKLLNNNKTVSYEELREKKSIPDRHALEQKIRVLFDNESNRYSYNCKIVFSDHEERHIIIGKTNTSLITRQERLIPIKNIIDIQLN